jgi:hypothetical protein
MRLITGNLPEPWIKLLLAHNVRYVEQFLAIVQDADAASRLAMALNAPLEALREVAARVLREQPDMVVPTPSGTN